MRIEHFAIGVCFDARGAEITPEALWAQMLGALTLRDIGGMAVYGGMACVHVELDSCYVCAFTNGSLKQMRRIYKKLLADAGVTTRLYAPRRFIQANTLARLDSLAYFGRVARSGEIAGGDAPFYNLRVRKQR